MLRFLGLLEVTRLRLTCRQVRDTLDHNVECIKVRPLPCTAMWSALHSAVTLPTFWPLIMMACRLERTLERSSFCAAIKLMLTSSRSGPRCSHG